MSGRAVVGSTIIDSRDVLMRISRRWVGGLPTALPYMLNISELRIATPSRASREPLGRLSGGTSTPCSFSRKAESPVALRSPYIGWKHPAVRAAMAATATSRAAMRVSNHDIHDPLRNDDDF